MNSTKELLAEYRVSIGEKPLDLSGERKKEAKRLTELLNSKKVYSYARIGDYEAAFLLAAKNNYTENIFVEENVVSGTEALTSLGLGLEHAARLKRALEEVDYLDTWECQWKNRTVLDLLDLKRVKEKSESPSRETSFILPTWVEHEMKDFCSGKRILFCGAEVPIMEELIKNSEYRNSLKVYIPDNCVISFLRPYENGKNLTKNLDVIKSQLLSAINENKIDILFLSLGGGSKIICNEIAQEKKIIAIDFGAMMRSLTYSGSDGNRNNRSIHSIFLFRVPFDIYMDALEKAFPNMTPEVLLAKAHAQLLLELQKKEVGWSYCAWDNDFKTENILYFKKAYKFYNKRYHQLFSYDKHCKKEREDLIKYLGINKIDFWCVLMLYIKIITRIKKKEKEDTCIEKNKGISGTLESMRLPLGNKPDPITSGRRLEAKRLTRLMSSSNQFSYLRIGDKDLAFLLYPKEVADEYNNKSSIASGTRTYGTPGLLPNQISRLKSSLEKATYVDFWEAQWKNDLWLKKLNLNRDCSLFKNPDRATSYIFPTWLEYEFKEFINNRRVLMVGAEVSILKSLIKEKEYKKIFNKIWPENTFLFFLDPRNNGVNPGENLDLIKLDIIKSVKKNNIDIVFISLGGAAKILCQEIANECRVIAFDFGVGIRSLTYSGSPGYASSRSTHSVFIEKIPFDLYMDALEDAFPVMDPIVLLSKAHAQLLLEIQKKEVGWSHASHEYDFSIPNRLSFYKYFKSYKKRYVNIFDVNPQGIKERADFKYFCGQHLLTIEGLFYFILVNLKKYLLSLYA